MQFQRLFTRRKLAATFSTIVDALTEKKAKFAALALLLNLICTVSLLVKATSTNSMALTAFAYLTIFDLLCLCTTLLSSWISHQMPTKNFSFGYDRFEVLAVFVCTTLTQLGAFFICKESVERLFQSERVDTTGQLPMVAFGLAVHLIVIYGVANRPFSQVSTVAASNLLQDTIQDFWKNLCGLAPILSRYMLQRLNPYVLLGEFAALVVIIEIILVERRESSLPDSVCGIIIALCTCITMFPLGVYSGMILLQATPTKLKENLDKCIREVNTLDGVLEIKDEHFWNVGFGKVAGSFHVRVRRDAEDQVILAELTHRLSPFLYYLAIQIFKDDWSLSGASYATLTMPQ